MRDVGQVIRNRPNESGFSYPRALRLVALLLLSFRNKEKQSIASMTISIVSEHYTTNNEAIQFRMDISKPEVESSEVA